MNVFANNEQDRKHNLERIRVETARFSVSGLYNDYCSKKKKKLSHNLPVIDEKAPLNFFYLFFFMIHASTD